MQQLKTADFDLFVTKLICNSWKQLTLLCLSPTLSATAENSWLCFVCPQTCLQQLTLFVCPQTCLQQLKAADFVLFVPKLICKSWKQLTLSPNLSATAENRSLYFLSPSLSAKAENSWLCFVCPQTYLQQLTLFCLLPNFSATNESSWLCFVFH